MTPTEIRDLREQFLAIDSDNNGEVSLDEFKSVLADKLDQSAIVQLFDQVPTAVVHGRRVLRNVEPGVSCGVLPTSQWPPGVRRRSAFSRPSIHPSIHLCVCLQMDRDHTKSISYSEFLAATLTRQHYTNEERIKRAFDELGTQPQ